MIGLVLVTHGRLAAEFVTAMEHVVGPQEAIEAICIGPDDDMEAPAQGHRQGDRQGRPGPGRDHPHRSVRRNSVEPRDQPDEERECRGHRRRQPADADPARGRAQGDAASTPRSPRRARPAANISPSLPRSSGKRRLDAPSAARSRSPTSAGFHARASAKFVNLASQLDAHDRRREGRQPRLRHLDHGPDDARRGDGRHDHHPRRGRCMPRRRWRSSRRWSRSASAKNDAPPGHRFLQRHRQAAALAARQEGARGPKGCSWPRACRILAEARDSGRLPEIIAFSAEGAKHPLAAEIIAATEAAGGEAIETTPDILSKMSRQGQSADAARRLPPAGHLARADRPSRSAAVDRRPGAARSRQYRHHPEDRRRGRRRRADPDRRLRRSLFGRGGARLDGRGVHPGHRGRALGRVRRLAALGRRASWSAPASRRRRIISKPNIASPASC